MKSPSTSSVRLATATTESFVPGALVMLGSFLKHHPRFNGYRKVFFHDSDMRVRAWTRSEVEKLQGFPRRHEPAGRLEPVGVQTL